MNNKKYWIWVFEKNLKEWKAYQEGKDHTLPVKEVPDKEVENIIYNLELLTTMPKVTNNFFVLNNILCWWYLDLRKIYVDYGNEDNDFSLKRLIQMKFPLMQERLYDFADASKKILVIGTGGTISCDRLKGFLVPTYRAEEIVSLEPMNFQITENLIFEDIENIDSSTMDLDIWIKISRDIYRLAQKHRPDGIVILQGSDQLAESANYLSFAFERLNIPIILTASMTQAIARGKKIEQSHAWLNIINSILVAAEGKFAEIGVCMNQKIIRGTRVYHPTQAEGGAFIGYEGSKEHYIGTIQAPTNLIEYMEKKRTRRGKNNNFPQPNIKVKKSHFLDVRGKNNGDIEKLLQQKDKHGLVVASDTGNFPKILESVNMAAEEGIPSMITSRVPGSESFPMYGPAQNVSKKITFCEDMLASSSWIKSWFVIAKAQELLKQHGKIHAKNKRTAIKTWVEARFTQKTYQEILIEEGRLDTYNANLYQKIMRKLMLRNFVREIKKPLSKASLKDIQWGDLHIQKK